MKEPVANESFRQHRSQHSDRTTVNYMQPGNPSYVHSLVIEQFACTIMRLHRCLNVASDYGGDDFLTIDPAKVSRWVGSDRYIQDKWRANCVRIATWGSTCHVVAAHNFLGWCAAACAQIQDLRQWLRRKTYLDTV